MNDLLADLIGENSYEIDFRLTPMGNTFLLQGKLTTTLDLQCSRCAIDFKFPVERALNEVLLFGTQLGKGEQMVKSNHAHEWEAQGPDYILLESEVFFVPDYMREVIALAEPMRPLGKPDCDASCENLLQSEKRDWLSLDSSAVHHNPFQVLEKMKLKS